MHKEMNLFNIFSAWGWGSYIGTLSNSCECRQSSCSPVVDGYSRTPRSSSWSRERAIWRECHCRSNSGGCLKSLNTASPRWRPFKWDIRFVVLKLDAFFPPLRILAEHTLQIAMALSSSATAKNFQTGEDMFTDDDVMSATQAESHLRSESRWISDKSDWLIDLPASYFIGSSYRISFIYRSNKNDVIFTHIGR